MGPVDPKQYTTSFAKSKVNQNTASLTGSLLVFIDEFKNVGERKLYKGEWNKRTGEREGLGVQFWPDGSKYEGQWLKDQASGQGRMTHANGDVY
jgi:hypothetical protein